MSAYGTMKQNTAVMINTVKRFTSAYLRLQVPTGGMHIQPLRYGGIRRAAGGAAADKEADTLLALVCQCHSPARLLYLRVHLGAGSDIFRKSRSPSKSDDSPRRIWHAWHRAEPCMRFTSTA